MNSTITEESGENLNKVIFEESTIVAETSSSEDEEEFIPATVVRGPIYKTLGLGSRAILRVDKPRSSKKGPLRPASSYFLGLPLLDKNGNREDDNIMKAPVCVRELFTRSPGEKRKWETSPSAGTPTVTSTPYFSCYYTPQVGISGSTLASFPSAAASLSPRSTPGDSPWSVGQCSRRRRLGLNGPMIVGVSRLHGIERLPSVEEQEDKKNIQGTGLAEYVELYKTKKEEIKTENEQMI